MNRRETDWADLPQTMTFDELAVHPLYAKYVDNGCVWQILLSNGTFYTMDIYDNEIGRKCPSDACLDRVYISNPH